MLKVSHEADDRLNGVLMEWWGADGTARALARDGDALLMERAAGSASLSDMAWHGQDDEVCRILCAAAARLHAPRSKPLPELTPLADWFGNLWPAADRYGGIFARSAETASALLAHPREVGALHGDLHHGNVLDFGVRGWLAIDPKYLIGERGFDFAHIVTNPDLADPARSVATQPGRFLRRLDVVAAASGLERRRLPAWVLAWIGLSVSWFLVDDDPLAEINLQIAALAVAELDRQEEHHRARRPISNSSRGCWSTDEWRLSGDATGFRHGWHKSNPEASAERSPNGRSAAVACAWRGGTGGRQRPTIVR